MDLNRNDSPNNNNNNNDGRKPGGNRPKGSIGTALLITLAIVLLVNWIYGSISKSQYTQTSFSDFLAAKDAGQLSEVEIQSDRIIYMTKEEAGKPAAMQKACYTGLPGGGDLIALSEELDAMGVKVEKKIVEDNSLIMMILSYALMIGGLFLVMNLLTKRMGGDGMMGGFGKSKAKVYMEKQTGVTFKDVAGQDEAKESLQEIIDFLHNPQKYTAIGAKLPKGALLVGSPGTGKTTVLKTILEVYRRLHPKGEIVLMAPTGRASRRMAGSTGFDNARTLHSGLGLVRHIQRDGQKTRQTLRRHLLQRLYHLIQIPGKARRHGIEQQKRQAAGANGIIGKAG